MPPPRFLTSNAAVRATTTAARMIWQSKIMTSGVVCEILAVIAAILNWVSNFWWLPNAALTLATLGAVAVATKIAWDYNGRGLNAQQRDDVNGILANTSLNKTQRDDVDGILAHTNLNQTQRTKIERLIQSSGLTPQQKLDLPAEIGKLDIAILVEAQKAVLAALDYLRGPDNRGPDHGHLVVIYRTGVRLDVRYVEPPRASSPCQRQHPHGQADDFNFVEVTNSLFQPFTNPTVLWKHPGNREICHTNYDDIDEPGNHLTFSPEDCVPKWRFPASGDYVLKHDALNGSAWEQQP